MITISPGFIIPFFLAAAAVACWQLVRIPRANPLIGMQFWAVLFCIVMMLLTNFLSHRNPWLSAGFFIVAVATLLLVLRQNRMVPPRERTR